MAEHKKIRELSDLNNICGILAHGCFDLIHIGHIRHLQAAKKLLPTETLIVTITADKHINKGPDRPVFTDKVRAEWLSSLECVDYVSIVDDPTAIPAIETIKPILFVKGAEYKDKLLQSEADAVIRNGGLIVFTPAEKEQISSTSILSGGYLRSKR